MSKHIINTEVLHRFMQIPTFFESHTNDSLKKEISTVRLEIKNCKQYIISTNQQIAAVEYLGETPESDDVCYLKLSDSLKKFINESFALANPFVVDTIPELSMASASSVGYEDMDACLWFDNNIMDDWRKWFGNNEVKPGTEPMLWDLFHLTKLFESSPSGKITFPVKIDSSKPVVLRDYEKDNWCGVFIPAEKNYKTVEPAKIPEWF